jgi:hypothetical protein
MSYIGKENTTDTVEGGDHLLLFGLFTKLSKAARVHPRHGVAADDVGRYERAPGGQHARR